MRKKSVERLLQRLEKDLELDQWWCKKDSRISNWSKEYKVRGVPLRMYMFCNYFRVILHKYDAFA